MAGVYYLLRRRLLSGLWNRNAPFVARQAGCSNESRDPTVEHFVSTGHTSTDDLMSLIRFARPNEAREEARGARGGHEPTGLVASNMSVLPIALSQQLSNL
jgi:hypothetical protein